MPYTVKAFAKIWKHSDNYIAVLKGLKPFINQLTNWQVVECPGMSPD